MSEEWCPGCDKQIDDCECRHVNRSHKVEGVGPDQPTCTNAKGGKQSDSPYRCDLLPATRVLSVAKVMAQGARKYGANNWRQIPRQDHINHALAHLFALTARDEQRRAKGAGSPIILAPIT